MKKTLSPLASFDGRAPCPEACHQVSSTRVESAGRRHGKSDQQHRIFPQMIDSRKRAKHAESLLSRGTYLPNKKDQTPLLFFILCPALSSQAYVGVLTATMSTRAGWLRFAGAVEMSAGSRKGRSERWQPHSLTHGYCKNSRMVL